MPRYQVQDKKRIARSIAAAIFGCTAMNALRAQAANYYWDINSSTGGATNTTTAAGIWDSSTVNNKNWTTSIAGTASTISWLDTSTAVFSAGTNATGTFTVSLASGVSILTAGISFEEGNVTIAPTGGSTLTLGSSTIDVSAGATATISQALSGTQGITKTSAGTLTLSGTNSFTGPISIQGGTLVLGNASGLPNGSALSISSGAALNLGSFSTQGSPKSFASLTGGGTISMTAPSELDIGTDNSSTTFSGIIAGGNGADFKKLGTGTLTLSGSNTYGGSTYIYGGIIKLGANGALPANTFISNLSASNTLDLNGFNQSAANPAAITNTSATLSTFTINATTTGLASSSSPMIGKLAVVFNDSHGLGNGWQTTGADNFTGGLTVNSGTIQLTNAKTFTGGIAINSGASIQTAADNSLGAVINNLTLNGGTLSVTSGFTSTRGVTLNSAGGTFNINTGQTLTWSGVINGTGALTKAGSGNLALSGTNTYTGFTNISAGKIIASASGAIPAASVVSMPTSGTIFDLNGFNQSFVSVSGVSGTTVTNSSATPATLTLSVPTAGEGNAAFAGVISGALSLVVNTNHSSTALSGLSTYTGTTTINGTGGIVNNISNALPTGTTLTVASAANYNTSGYLQTLGSLQGSGSVELSSGGLTVTENGNHTFSGAIDGAGGSFTMAGTGTLALTGNSTLTGPMTVSSGTLALAGNQIPSSITVAGLSPAALSQTAGVITVSSATQVSDGGSYTISAGSLSTANLYLGGTAAASSGAGTLTMNGGTVTNSAASKIWSGGLLQLNGGTLAVNGPLTSSGTISVAGGTLTGTSSISGPVTLSSGILTSGAATPTPSGTLTLSSLNMTGGSLQFDISGSSSNTIQVNGPVSFSSVNLSFLMATVPVSPAQITLLSSTQALPTSGLNLSPVTIGRATLTPSISGSNLIVTTALQSSATTWNNAGGSGDGLTWDVQNNQNWNLSGTPTQFFVGDNVTFSDTNNGHSSITIASAMTPSSVTFTNNSANYSFTGNGGIVGGGGLTMNGSGNVTFATSNSYGGNTTVNNGSLTLASGGSIASVNTIVNAGSVSISSGGSLGGTNLSINGGSVTDSGSISSNNINVSASATLLINAAASVSMLTQLNDSGTTTFDNPAPVISTLNGSGLLKLENSTLSINNGGTFTGNIQDGSGAGSLTVNGGILTLSGINSFTGVTTVHSGTLSVGSNTNLGSGSVSLDGGTLRSTGTFTLSDSISISPSGGSISVASGSVLATGGTLSGGGPLTKAGAGTLVINGSSLLFSGGITISGGTVSVASNPALGAAGSNVQLDGGTLQATADFSTGRAISLTFNNGSIDVAAGKTLTVSSAISGQGGLTKLGLGTLALSTSNNYTGATVISAGTLSLPGGSLYTFNDVTVAAGALFDASGSNSPSIGSLSGAGNVGSPSDLTVGWNGFSKTFSGVISGGSTFTKVGSGTLTLSGPNSYSIATNLNGGTLQLGRSNALPVGASIVFNNTQATFDLNGFDQTVLALTGNSGAGTVTNSNPSSLSTLTFSPTAGFPASYDGQISGNISIVKNGVGTQTLTQSQGYYGSTTVNAGTLAVTNSLPSISPVFIAGGATLDLSGGFGGFGATIGALSGSGNLIIGSSTLALNTSTDQTFLGSITGTGGLSLLGSGTFTLAGVPGVNGSIMANGGTLKLISQTNDNSFGGTLSLNSTTLQTTASMTISRPISVSLATIDVATNTTLQLFGSLTGSNFTKTGSGSLLLMGPGNNFSGPLTIQNGRVISSGFNTVPSTTAVIVNASGILDFTSISNQTNSIGSLAGAGSVLVSDHGTLNVGGDNSSTTFSGVISGNGGLRKSGGGLLALSSQNTYTGTTEIAGGVIQLGINNALPVGTSFTTASTGSLDMNGFSQTISDTTSGNGAPTVTVFNNAATLSTFTIKSTANSLVQFGGVFNNNIAVVFNGVPGGTGGWQFKGNDLFTDGLTVQAGTLELTNSRGFSGGVTINTGGTVLADSDAALGSSSNVITLAGGTLSFGLGYTTARSISVGASGGSLNATGAVTFSGSIAGSGSLSTSGGGSILINTPQSLSGSVTIASPVVLMNGTLNGGSTSGALTSASSITIGTGGTLTLDNTANTADRIGDLNPITLAGGSFVLIGKSNTGSTETTGALGLTTGASTVTVSGVNSTISFSGSGGIVTTGRHGGTVNFFPSADKISIGGQAAGFVAGWATVNGTDFASYSTATGIAPVSNYTTTFGANNNVAITAATASDPTLNINTASGTTTPAAATLKLNTANGPLTLSQSTVSVFTLTNGGLLKIGSNLATITGGSMTAGSAAEVDAYIQAGSLVLATNLIDNPAFPGTGLSLVKSGPGTLVLGTGSGDTTANNYTGTTYIQQGVLELNKASGTFAIRGPLEVTGGSLQLDRPDQIDPNSGLTVRSGAVNFAGSATFSTGTFLGGTVTVQPGEQLTIPGPVGPGIIHPLAGSNPVTIASTAAVHALAGSTLSYGGITFQGTNPSIVLDPGATPGLLTMNGNVTVITTTSAITSATPGNGQLAGTIDLNGSRSFTIPSGDTMTISARIIDSTGTGKLIQSGGSLILTAANTFAGGTNLSGGTLQVTNPSGLGASSSIVTFSNSGVLQLRSDAATTTFPQPVTTDPAGAVAVDLGPISSSNVAAENFQMGAAALGVSLTVTGTKGDSLAFTSAVLNNNTGNATAIHASANLNINGLITQTGTNGDIKITDGGTVAFAGTGANAYTGSTTVSGAKLVLSQTSGVAVPHDLLIINGGKVQLTAANQIATSSSVTLNNVPAGAALDLGGFDNTIGALNFIAGGAVTTGGGTLKLNGDVNFSGIAGAATISDNLNLGGVSRTFTVADGSAATDMTVSANVSGSLGASGVVLRKAGPGTLALTGSSNIFGGAGQTINVDAGILQALTDGSLGDSHNSLVISNAATGAELQATGTFESTRAVSLGAGGGGLDVPTLLTLTLDGPITGNTGIVKSGAGTLILNGTNTFTGGITIKSGVVNVASAASLGASDSSNPIILAGGTLVAGGAGLTLDSQFNFSALATFDASAASPVIFSSNSVLGGSGGLVKVNTGTLTINSIQQWANGALLSATAGTVNVNSQINTVSGNAVLSLAVSGGATVNLNGFAQPLAAITLDSLGLLTNNGGASTASGAWAVTGAGGKVNLTAPFTVSGSTTTAWSGAFTQAGTSTLSINRTGGAVTVAAGSSITVNQGTLSAGGTVDPFTDTNTHLHIPLTNNASFSVSTVAATGVDVASLTGTGSTAIASGSTLYVGSSPGTINQSSVTVTGLLATNGNTGTVYGPVTLAAASPAALSVPLGGAAQVGSLTFTANEGGATVVGSLTASYIRAGALNATGTVTLRPDGTAANLNVLTALNLTGNGKLDLNDNDAIIQGGVANLSKIFISLKSGFNAGSGFWNGPAGIISTSAANNTRSLTTLGYRAGGSSFDGFNTTSADLLVKYTYFGDADLNGTLNGADYQQIDSGFSSGGAFSGWASGDFNYDGVINGSDFSLIDNTFNQLTATGAGSLAIVATPANLVAAPSDLIAVPATANAVPEPAAFSLLTIAAVGLLGRRRRSFSGKTPL